MRIHLDIHPCSASAFLFFVILSVASAQQNHVLSLDSDGDYVRLPSDIFIDSDQATVEGWVRWKTLTPWGRFFDFGEQHKSVHVRRDAETNHLSFVVDEKNGQPHVITAPNVLTEKTWYHIAVVWGSGGMKFYLNGFLVGENPYDGSFSHAESGRNNYLGKINWEGERATSGIFKQKGKKFHKHHRC